MYLTVFFTILTMLIYALPGFLLIKTKLVKQNAIPAFSVFLMYVLQPCLTVYSFQKITFSGAVLLNMLVCFLVALLGMGAFLAIFYFLIVRKRKQDVSWRVANVAAVFGNASFIGIPILETVLPDTAEAATYSITFFLAMSMLGWTVASALITQDKKYISVKKIFLNPSFLSIVVASLLGVADVLWGFKLSSLPPLSDSVTVLAKMSTPMCMLAMGARLATVDLKKLFLTAKHYLVILLKQFVFPLCVFGLVFFLPVDYELKVCLFVMSCCPTAAVVQSYAEMVGEGQESAADMVLLSSTTCVFSIPLMTLLISFL